MELKDIVAQDDPLQHLIDAENRGVDLYQGEGNPAPAKEPVVEPKKEEKKEEVIPDGKSVDEVAAEKKEAERLKAEEDAKAAEQPVEEQSLLDELVNQFEFDTDKEYTEDNQGLFQLVNDITDSKANNLIDSYLDSVPGLREYHDFVKLGGDSKAYFSASHPELDFSKLSLDSLENQRMVVARHLKNQGFNDEQVKTKLERYEVTSAIKDEAEDALVILKANQEKEKLTLIENQKQAALQAKKENEEYWTNFNEMLKNSTSLKNLPIGIEKKKQLVSYMTLPVKDGKSQYQMDLEKEKTDIESHAFGAYIRMLKYNLGDYIKTTATSQNAERRRLQFRAKSEAPVTGSGTTKNTTTKTLNLDTLHQDVLNEYDKQN